MSGVQLSPENVWREESLQDEHHCQVMCVCTAGGRHHPFSSRAQCETLVCTNLSWWCWSDMVPVPIQKGEVEILRILRNVPVLSRNGDAPHLCQ